MLLGLLPPTRGGAVVLGAPAGPSGATRANIGYVSEGRSIPYSWMRVSDLLSHHASYFPTWDGAYATQLSSLLQLRLNDRFGRLSKGEARRVELVMALAHRPRLLLLDEPTDGLDPVVRSTVLRVLTEHMTESPTTMLIATHLIYEMEGLADHIGILREGSLVAQLNREQMHARLRRYVLEVPVSWSAPAIPFTVLKENGTPREPRWTIWGDESEVRIALERSGATIRSIAGLTLDEAALALLQQEQA
jgi:ABC-2 type transport system ATP-binding protein